MHFLSFHRNPLTHSLQPSFTLAGSKSQADRNRLLKGSDDDDDDDHNDDEAIMMSTNE